MGAENDDGLDLAEHLLSLLDDELRERWGWGWRGLQLLDRSHGMYLEEPVVRLYASGLRIPMYVGYVDVDTAARAVLFVAVDQRAPDEQEWRRSPPAAWWDVLGGHPRFASLLGASRRRRASARPRAIDELRPQVLHVLETLEPGEVITYGEIATECGAPKQSRLVGRILGEGHPDVPWWRVVNAAGRFVPGHEAEQRRRLTEEGVDLTDRGVRMSRR